MMELDKKKVLCVVRNPTDRTNQSWFYNNFLGHLHKNKKSKNEIKVNWLIALTPAEISVLKEKTCKVIELTEDIEISIEKDEEEQFKQGFKVLFNLFNNAMKNNGVKEKIKEILTGDDGKPSDDYKIIIETKKLLEE